MDEKELLQMIRNGIEEMKNADYKPDKVSLAFHTALMVDNLEALIIKK